MTFEAMLTGGHPNSLGRTLEVVDAVLADRALLPPLLDTYRSDDEVVRLRTSNAVKRVTVEHPDWTVEHMDRLQGEVAGIDQASTQWTLALIFDLTWDLLNATERARALEIMRTNLAEHDDWIVLNNSMKVLAKRDPDRAALKPLIEGRVDDERKSVRSQAAKALKAIA